MSPYGPLAGLIPPSTVEPSAITAWTTAGLRRAFLVKSISPRRRGAGTEDEASGSPVGVGPGGVFAGHSGCRDRSQPSGPVPGCGGIRAPALGVWNSRKPSSKARPPTVGRGTDPSHVSRRRLPTLLPVTWLCCTVCEGRISRSAVRALRARARLIQAASLLRHGQADLAIVLAGDTLTRSVYEWYEAADLLSPACYNSEPLPEGGGFVPSEGVAALVLEPAGRREARSLCPTQVGPLGGRRASAGRGGDHPPDARRFGSESHRFAPGTARHVLPAPVTAVWRARLPVRRQPIVPAAGRCRGFSRNRRSSPLDLGLEQPASCRTATRLLLA